MNSSDIQDLVAEFIVLHERQQGQPPSIGDIARGSGVNDYTEVTRALDALEARGLVAYVGGGSSFTQRRVRWAGRSAPPGAATAAPPPSRPPRASKAKPAPGKQATHHARAVRAPSPPRSQATASTSTPPPPGPANATWSGASPGWQVQQPLPPAGASAGLGAAARQGSRAGSRRGAAQSPAGWSAGPGWSFDPATLRAHAVPLGALLFAAAAGVLLLLARSAPTGIRSTPSLSLGPLALPLTGILVLALAGLLGALVARGWEAAGGWTAGDLGRALALGAFGALPALAWAWLRPLVEAAWAPLAPTGLPSLAGLVVDGVRALPAMLPAAWLPWPGAASIGLLTGQGISAIAVGPGLPALALLQALLAALPLELWLAHRGQDRGRRTLVLGGLLLGLGSVAAGYLTVPAVLASDAWLAELVGRGLGGAAAGWAVAWLAERRRRPPVPGAPR